ncbi:MAG: alpha/beta fold hydrolase [Sphingomonadales bacterium]|nr:alpha/beta fold hydrolase [Sphingomonadales bacterium]
MSGDCSWQPDAESRISVRFIEANGLTFELAECGDRTSGTLALMLHGFPELNYSWRHQMPMLANKGYRVWAPNMRGYGASSKPEGIPAYHIDNLLADVAALIDHANAEQPIERMILIAHDWGAVIAWMFAIRKLRHVDQLVIMNVPHPKCAEREIRKWRQLRKSWYMFFFQLPWLPEKLLLAGNARAIRGAFFNTAANKSNFTRADLEVYAAAAQRPGAIRSMVNYYRALFRYRDSDALGDAKVAMPTLVIWGENDLALDIHLLDGMEAWVPDLTVHRLPGISHWVQQDAPEAVNSVLSDWLDNRAS